MKRLYFAFFAAIVLSTALHAQNNNLVVYSQDGLKFTVILNGIRQNSQPETNVKITGLNAPNYSMKIIFANALPDIDKNIYCMEGGNLSRNTEFSNAIVYKKGKYKLRFASVGRMNAGGVRHPRRMEQAPQPIPLKQQLLMLGCSVLAQQLPPQQPLLPATEMRTTAASMVITVTTIITTTCARTTVTTRRRARQMPIPTTGLIQCPVITAYTVARYRCRLQILKARRK